MAQYRFAPIWNAYILEPETENFSLADVEEHGDANAGVTGNSLDNVITGDAKNNNLDGGMGADTLIGGLGDDAYVVEDAGDVVIEAADGGTNDLITAYVSYTLPDHVEVLVLQGYENLTGAGNDGANTLIGSDGGSNLLEGMGGNDRLFGYAGDDTLDGGEGADELWGWSGNDTFIVDDPGDIVTEDDDRGEDWVIASISYTLRNHVEHLHLKGSQGLTGIGNELDNRIIGNEGSNILEGRDGNDTLDGGTGADTLRGGTGDDSYLIDSTADVIEEEDDGGTDRVETSVSHALAAFVENLFASGNAAISLTGNALGNTIHGNGAANTLDGGAGVDTLEGGAGDDVYLVDDAGDLVTEADGEGTEWVEAAIDYALGDHLENLRLMGSQALAGQGNRLANQLIGALGNDTLEGDGGNDTLDGGAGADRLAGGVDDDLYQVDDPDDVVVELDGEGVDRVETSVSHALAAFVENLVAIGSAAVTLTGNALNNIIHGNAAANVLDGGAGGDTLEGGAGDDTYIVDDGDQVLEEAGGGIDTVRSATSYILGDHLERLIATGLAAVALTGNGLDNTLIGNAAANTFDGGAGADHLVGGDGDDTYIVDAADSIAELAGEGIDTVLTRSSFILGEHLENLTAAGTASIDLTGNGLNNRLTGNAAANVLDGGAGADILSGGDGDDTYIVDGADTIIELSGGGTDTVYSAFSHRLGDALENLAATGSSAIDLTGNALNNRLAGNAATNVIDGGSGADVMEGGAGDDILIVDNAGDGVSGGSGTDTVQTAISFSLGADVENLTAAAGIATLLLTGNAFGNSIIGNGGANRISGGLGNDQLSGGKGKDVFLFDTKPHKSANRDKILDFSVKDDSVWLENKVFKKLGTKGSEKKPAKLAKDFFALDKAKDANDHLIYSKKTGKLFYDADGSGKGKAVEIATISKKLAMTHKDFFVI